MTSTVEVIGRTIRNEIEQPQDPNGDLSREVVQLAQAVLFELGKAGIRVVEPSDVMYEGRVEDGKSAVVLVLKVES